ncbi:MAG TPA: J domain-containing protein [Capillimicrobium sp.]|nr:J domain-containing protein [Capillimicrobium sp.]
MDPFALLGVSPDATPEELAAAYRRLAKEWHPDTHATSEASFKMAQINAAYDAAREVVRRRDGRGGRPAASRERTRRRRPRAGAWLDPRVRRALGPELLGALHDGEPVRLVTRTSTWASPQARLAVTDRRLLWVLEDAISDRVRWLRLEAVVGAEHRLSWPRRRSASVRVRDELGRRHVFAELTPAIASEVVGLLRARRAA